MSLNSILTRDLAVVAPVEASVYSGDREKYITFSYGDYPDGYADDEPQYDKKTVSVHYYCPLGYNPLSDISKIKKILVQCGLSYPVKVDASDENNQHYVFECQFIEKAEV